MKDNEMTSNVQEPNQMFAWFHSSWRKKIATHRYFDKIYESFAIWDG